MDTETLTVTANGEDFEITIQHDQTGSAYGMKLSKSAYEQLRNHFIQNPKLTKCSNCGDVVEMISNGEFCHNCFC